MKYLRRIVENFNGDIYVFDYKEGCVYIFIYDGKVRYRYIGIEFIKFGELCGIICDCYGYMIIVDYKSNCIYFLD